MERIELDKRVFERCSYAVIDPTHADPAFQKRLPVQSLAPQTHVDQVLRLPFFLNLSSLGTTERSDLFSEVIESVSTGGGAMLSLLIETSQTPGSVIRHLQRMMIAYSPDERKPYQLRYHDAVTLMQLRWILNADQQKTMIGPSSAWYCPLEHWWRFQPEETAAGMPALRLGVEQWQQLLRVGTINEALGRQDVRDEQRTALGKQLYLGLANAESLGLSDEEDMIGFAVHTITYHPEFHRHRIIAQILAQSKGRPRRYTRLTSALSDADWQRIATAMSTFSA